MIDYAPWNLFALIMLLELHGWDGGLGGGGGGGSDSVCLGKQILLLLISKCNADNETL